MLIPCHPDLFFDSLCVQHTGFWYQFLACIIFLDSLKNIRVTAAIPIFFVKFRTCHAYFSKTTFFTTFLVTFPSLHQFFRKFGKISGSRQPSFIFFVKLSACHPDINKTVCFIHFVFNILNTGINS